MSAGIWGALKSTLQHCSKTCQKSLSTIEKTTVILERRLKKNELSLEFSSHRIV